jgi:mRNA interferase MazF
VVKRSYIPDAGDIVWLRFDPQAGHEQSGRHPARYNGARGMAICCPMTTKIKGYVFEVVITDRPPSAILADQIRSLDWRARRAVRKGAAEPRVVAEVRAKIKALLML